MTVRYESLKKTARRRPAAAWRLPVWLLLLVLFANPIKRRPGRALYSAGGGHAANQRLEHFAIAGHRAPHGGALVRRGFGPDGKLFLFGRDWFSFRPRAALFRFTPDHHRRRRSAGRLLNTVIEQPTFAARPFSPSAEFEIGTGRIFPVGAAVG